MKWILGIVASYLIGSIPTAFLVGKSVRGIDIRKHGSGNVGATNVFRVIGKKWGIGVLVFDMFKGFFTAFWLPRHFAAPTLDPFVLSLAFGIAAIMGHTWTLWLGFCGGKGVAISAGVFLALTPRAACVSLLIWIVLFSWKRYVSFASLGTALSFPVAVFGFYRKADSFRILFPVSVCLMFFIFYTNRENIRRLREGTEKKIL